MSMMKRAEMELTRARVVLDYLRQQEMEIEKEARRLMKRLGIDTNDQGDLPRPIYCTSCGFKMVDADQLATIAGQWTCSECYADFILQVDGIDLNTEEGQEAYSEMAEEMTPEEWDDWKEEHAL